MPHLDYAIPCRLTSVDVRTSALSLFAVVESLEFVRSLTTWDSGAPDQAVSLELVSLWRLAPGEMPGPYTQVVQILGPDGTSDEVSRVEFTIEHLRHRLHVTLPVEFARPGAHTLSVGLLEPGGVVECHRYPITVSISDQVIVIELERDEVEYLRRPVVGSGGFQSLLRHLNAQLVADRLVLTEGDAERLVRYARAYGQGGFQHRLGRVVDQVAGKLAEQAS
jgi:hypothetical protein